MRWLEEYDIFSGFENISSFSLFVLNVLAHVALVMRDLITRECTESISASVGEYNRVV